jgi:hypothetical protein
MTLKRLLAKEGYKVTTPQKRGYIPEGPGIKRSRLHRKAL